MKMTCLVDASHASNKVTYRSHTGIFILLNNAPVVWYSKRQNTVESSTFGSEFVALRVATELIEGLRYKLRMFDVPIDGATPVYRDNQICDEKRYCSSPALSKKYNPIRYHKVRESVASCWTSIAWIKSQDNLADLFTKVLPRVTRNDLVDEMIIRCDLVEPVNSLH